MKVAFPNPRRIQRFKKPSSNLRAFRIRPWCAKFLKIFSNKKHGFSDDIQPEYKHKWKLDVK